MLLTIYVDDFKMAGNKENLPKMWTKIGKLLDLEPAVKMDGHVYLGCKQETVEVPKEKVDTTAEFVRNVLSRGKAARKGTMRNMRRPSWTRANSRAPGDWGKSTKFTVGSTTWWGRQNSV